MHDDHGRVEVGTSDSLKGRRVDHNNTLDRLADRKRSYSTAVHLRSRQIRNAKEYEDEGMPVSYLVRACKQLARSTSRLRGSTGQTQYWSHIDT